MPEEESTTAKLKQITKIVREYQSRETAALTGQNPNGEQVVIKQIVDIPTQVYSSVTFGFCDIDGRTILVVECGTIDQDQITDYLVQGYIVTEQNIDHQGQIVDTPQTWLPVETALTNPSYYWIRDNYLPA